MPSSSASACCTCSEEASRNILWLSWTWSASARKKRYATVAEKLPSSSNQYRTDSQTWALSLLYRECMCWNACLKAIACCWHKASDFTCSTKLPYASPEVACASFGSIKTCKCPAPTAIASSQSQPFLQLCCKLLIWGYHRFPRNTLKLAKKHSL